jgi:hypothetical protein
MESSILKNISLPRKILISYCRFKDPLMTKHRDKMKYLNKIHHKLLLLYKEIFHCQVWIIMMVKKAKRIQIVKSKSRMQWSSMRFSFSQELRNLTKSCINIRFNSKFRKTTCIWLEVVSINLWLKARLISILIWS